MSGTSRHGPRLAAVTVAAVLLAAGSTQAAEHAHRPAPLAEAKMDYVPFRNSPFPYRGIIPEKDIPFLDASDGTRRGHTSPRAGTIYWEDQVYSDRRALIYFPPGFDLAKPAVVVVFFHGNSATLSRDVVERQQVPRQLAESGLNAVLIAPQFALDALDSSAGNFWTPGFFAGFLDEAAGKMARLYGRESARAVFARMPVVILAYSGGYNPAAYSVALGGAARRVKGVLLLDAIYAEEDKFAHWIRRNRKTAFFFSAYTKSSAASNAALRDLLGAARIGFATDEPGSLRPGDVVFLAADPELVHDDFVTHAWVNDPVKWLLARLGGYRK